MKITTLFPALGVKNYRVFWITQWIALIGFWLQLTTQQWLVYKMTDSAFLLGLLSACQFTPSLLFTLGTGLWIDHHNKRKILMGTQSLYMLQALLLGLLLLSGHETYGWLLFFAFFLTENCPSSRTHCRNSQYPSNDNQHRTACTLFRRT